MGTALNMSRRRKREVSTTNVNGAHACRSTKKARGCDVGKRPARV